jgi:sorting nexin-1/2
LASSTNSTSVSSTASPIPPTSTSEPLLSPLEQRPSGPGLNRSFASLALGGESVGGWQGAQSSSWSHETSSTHVPNDKSADDSDDDKPIRQNWKPTEPAEPTSVSMLVFIIGAPC